ncbi:MAG: hypothetical protein ACXAC2_21805 [Candidatus Kariarchaeaceae archaeon]|jgi:hypothetical protein
MRNEIKILLISAILVTSMFSVAILSGPVLAAADVYWANVTMNFYVPSDTLFAVQFPNDFTGAGYNFTANNDTLGTWIGFNFTSGTEQWVQPSTNATGGANAQTGPSKPIMRVENLGNVNESIWINGTVPANFAVCANATCGDCEDGVAACTDIDVAAFFYLFRNLTTGGFGNVTLYGNASGASPGSAQGSLFLWGNSTYQ